MHSSENDEDNGWAGTGWKLKHAWRQTDENSLFQTPESLHILRGKGLPALSASHNRCSCNRPAA